MSYRYTPGMTMSSLGYNHHGYMLHLNKVVFAVLSFRWWGIYDLVHLKFLTEFFHLCRFSRHKSCTILLGILPSVWDSLQTCLTARAALLDSFFFIRHFKTFCSSAYDDGIVRLAELGSEPWDIILCAYMSPHLQISEHRYCQKQQEMVEKLLK